MGLLGVGLLRWANRLQASSHMGLVGLVLGWWWVVGCGVVCRWENRLQASSHMGLVGLVLGWWWVVGCGVVL